MVFNYFTLLTALALSASAIYYSVTGLAIIFAGAYIPVIVMGTILEVSKLVAAVWLHRNWDIAVWWLKIYLTIAVLVLMFITSMGIFGYLSKSHIQQAADSQDQIAKIQSITEHLILSNNKIGRWNKQLEGLVSGTNIRVDTVLLREQKELDQVYARMETEKEKIQRAGDGDIALQTQRLEQAQSRKDSAIKALGKKPSRNAVSRLQSQELSVASRAQKEIIKIQASTKELLLTVEPKYVEQIAEIQQRITALKNQSGDGLETIETKIVALETKLITEQKVIDQLSDKKAVFESRTRKLEAEVGPIRYIAEFIYKDDATQSILEEAVKWVIVVIIFVFDPLAVLLLIATQYSFRARRKELQLKAIVHEEVVEEVDHVLHTKEPVMPPNEVINESEIPNFNIKAPEFTMTTESFKPHKFPEENELTDDEIDALIERNKTKHLKKVNHVVMNKVGDNYVNYNGKLYRDDALYQTNPDLNFNIVSNVRFGNKYLSNAQEGELFIRIDMLPTQVFRFNGVNWDAIDKSLIGPSAYSDDYINALINLIASNEYNPELLNKAEKKHIERILSQT